MPRLLIADENSNVQKSVSLALKDTGIEVVAVGNGGAAVRKMAEISPDLVLADIFMPVHNGYEVCDFVKGHPQYMHTPVVLLIGAFDPLDEREAERVRADGVLTKPFMPPDSLISMVTGLLAKSAEERLVAVPVRVSGEAEAGKEVKPEPEASVPEFADPPAEEFALPSGSVSFAGDEKPLAFGSLLESPPAPADEAEPVVSSASDPVLEEPVFWSEPPATEAAAETDETDETDETEETEETKETDDMVAEVDEFSLDSAATHTDTEPTDMQPNEWPMAEVPVANGPAAAESAPADISIEDNLLPPADAFQSGESAAADEDEQVPNAAELELSIPYAAPAPEPAAECEPEPPLEPSFPALEEIAGSAAGVEPTEPPLMSLSGSGPGSGPDSEPDSEPTATPERQPGTELQLERDADLESQQPAVEAGPLELAPAWENDFGPPPGIVPPAIGVPEENPEPASAEPLQAPPAELATLVTDAAAAQLEKPAQPSTELVGSLVAQVMERMQPQMIEIVTLEILRPVVEALVRRELEKKKQPAFSNCGKTSRFLLPCSRPVSTQCQFDPSLGRPYS